MQTADPSKDQNEVQACTKSEHYRTWLLEELVRRRSKNRSYSLRAFARDLGISSTALSDVLNKKRNFSKRNALQVADRLGLSPKQLHVLLQEIRGRQVETGEESALQLQEDTFAVISDWYYFAILNLAKIPNNRADEKWVALRLGISVHEVRQALERLQRLELLKIKEGRLVRTTQNLSTLDNVPSAIVRKFHQQHLELASQSIERVPLQDRDITTMTMAIRKDRLVEARKRIRRFREKLTQFLEQGEGEEVYTLTIQLFPLTHQGETT